MLLSREAIFGIQDVPVQVIDVPEWGVGAQIKIKAMSIKEQIAYEKAVSGKKDESDIIFNMLILCCVDDNNKQIFSSSDIALLQEKSSSAILRIFNACLKLNSLDTGGIENIAKN